MLTGIDQRTGREYAFADYLLIPDPIRLERDGQLVALAPNALKTLLVLIENRGRTVSKYELLERVWDGAAVDENNLSQYITALRKAFGDSRKDGRFIATVSGTGYRFMLEVTVRERPGIATPPVAGPLVQVPAHAHPAAVSLRRHKIVFGSIAALGVVLAAAAAVRHWSPAPRPSETAILVLPLESFGPGGADVEYIRKGFSTEIEAALARTPNIHVAAGIPEPVRSRGTIAEVARAVNAQAVLRGQIRSDRNRLNFTFELVNPETSRILWSDQFGMMNTELAAAESRVVSGVVNTMNPAVSAPERRPVNPAAHELYLRGRLLAASRQPEDLEKAIPMFERAVQIDPSYADAYTGIADAASIWAANVVAPPGTIAKAKSAALRAIELEPGAAPAHAALGLAYYGDWNWSAARGELQEAVRLNPFYSNTHHRLAMVDYAFNDYSGAEAELKLARGINPHLMGHALTLAELYIPARRYDDAIAVISSIHGGSENRSGHCLLSSAYREKGDRASTSRELRLALQLGDSPDVRALLAIAEGRPEEAKRIAAVNGKDDTNWATVYARLGDRRRLFALLRKLIDNRNVAVIQIKDEPAYDPYRSDPEFQHLIGRLHLPSSR